MEVSSKFTSHEFVSTFRKIIKVSGARDENHVMIDPVTVDGYVTTVKTREPHYFYMYTHVFQTLNLWLPFTPFESQILKAMNVAPCLLHPNSWAFVKAFEIVCTSLDLVPTVGTFFCFFQVKNDTFVHFRCGEGYPELMFDESGKPLFRFYRSPAPRLIRGTRVESLNDYEREIVKFLARSKVMGSSDLIARETNPNPLGEYLPSMSTLSNEARMALVLKAREEKAKAAAAAASTDFYHSCHSHADLEAVTKEASPSITCCPANPEKKNKKDSSPSKDFDSLSYVAEGFHKYINPSPLADVSSDDLKKTAMDHHVQGAMINYLLSARQELELIEARNKMKTVDEHLESLEKEYAATKTRLDDDIKGLKASKDEAVKEAVKAKEDEWAKEKKIFVDEATTLRERAKTLEERLASTTKERD
ncbi:hypothetical protein TSUD_400010 [Trifolium subterraneum]|uniref:Uncharacterized protein n=1 Tax=Trifolium subterraneum TaxID=3900 RepID=A0A2Z6P7J5_TRISU|nr:hypothetical protein TSUD_400010 [Trifolium subterraneum]